MPADGAFLCHMHSHAARTGLEHPHQLGAAPEGSANENISTLSN